MGKVTTIRLREQDIKALEWMKLYTGLRESSIIRMAINRLGQRLRKVSEREEMEAVGHGGTSKRE